jgi:hypothetical protein
VAHALEARGKQSLPKPSFAPHKLHSGIVRVSKEMLGQWFRDEKGGGLHLTHASRHSQIKADRLAKHSVVSSTTNTQLSCYHTNKVITPSTARRVCRAELTNSQ